MTFILKRRDELKGGDSSGQIDSAVRLQQLEGEHFRLLQKINRLKATLEHAPEKGTFELCVDGLAWAAGYGTSDKSSSAGGFLSGFMEHSDDGAWKRAVTRFLVANRSGGLRFTFLTLCESYREQFRLERKLLELRSSPEELARLDEQERQAEEQSKKEAVEKTKKT